MKTRTRKVQIIALVLSVLMLLNIPLPVLAEAAIENAIEEAQNQPVLIVDKLTETETYWQNADGSVTYEQHLEPIRYQDEAGNWHEIVNDIVQVDKSAESTDAFKEEPYDYRSESSKNWVLFKSSMFEENPIKVQNGERVVYIRPVRTLPLPTAKPEATLEPTPEAAPSLQPTETPQLTPENTTPQETPQPTDELLENEAEDTVSQGALHNAQQTANASLQEEQEESRLSFHLKEDEPEQQKAKRRAQDETAYDPYVYNPELEYQAVEYSNVFGNGMGLYLCPNNSGLKEDIVLQSRPSVDRFSFEIKIDQGVLEKQDNNEILWKDAETGEEYGYIPTPYMIDSGTREEYENISTDIEVLLEAKEEEQGVYLYTLVPSAAYLDDENTVYPVRIDPSIQLPRDGYVSDTYVSSGEPNRNFASNQYIRVGHDTDNVLFRGIIYHTLPNLTGRYIDSANLKLYQSYDGTTQPSIQTYRMYDDYKNVDVTWNTQPRSVSGYTSVTVGHIGWYTWDITRMERDWQKGAYPNYGIFLVSNHEAKQWYKRFYSLEGTNKPVFTINYRDINRNFTATGRPGAINSSSQFIDVNWTNTPGVSVKVCLDGKEYTPSGSTSHTFSVSSYVSHKVKIKYTTDYGATCYSSEKTVEPVADRTPPIFNTTSEVSISDGNLSVNFAPALKPNSVKNVAFPAWASQGGQDDLVWHSSTNSGNGTWSATINIADHPTTDGQIYLDCYATTADGVTDYFGGLNFNINSDETEWTGIVRQHPDWGGKTGRGIAATIKVTRSSPTATTFTVTATGVSQTGMISKHELFWSELNSEELHPLDTIETTGWGEGVIAKSYDIRDKELPGGTTINVYAKATDKYGNYTIPNLLLGTVDIPNYVSPQAPQLSVYSGDQYYTMGQEPLFPIGDTAVIRWNIEKGLGSDFDIGFVQYSFDKETWITVSSDNWLDKGEGKTAAVNGTVISTADLPEGISEVYVRGVDNNPVPEQALAGEISSIKILKDTKAPVLHVTYPTAIEEVEGIPKWEISDVVSITNIEEARLQSVKVEIGHKLSWLPTENLYFYQTVYEWTEGVHAPIAYPLGIDLTSVAPDGQYQIKITVTDKSGNVVTEERKFLLNATMSYSKPDFYLHADQYEAYEQLIHIQEVPLVLDISSCNYAPDLGHTMYVRVDGQEIDYTYDAETKRVTINPLSEQNQHIFKPGEWLPIIIAIEQPSGDALFYSCATFSSGEDAADTEYISDMENFEIREGKLTLTANSGSFVFTSPQMGPAPIGNIKFDYSVLNNTELPDKTKIEFVIELLDQEGNVTGVMFQEFRSGDMVNTTGWNYADGTNAYQYRMTVTITQPEGQTDTATIDSLGFTTTYLAAPTYVNTELIAPASGLSAMPLVNYTTWLRWTGSPTEGAVYDIYRSESDTLDMETIQPIASNLATTYYYDHDLVPGKTFNYWVVAKKEYQVEGETVTMFAQSQPSPKQTATMVDENELDKQLGLQDYWSYATVPVGDANGYINVSSGNLVYQQVDLEMVAPLLASTMRRTYNSQAKSYTALGKGWDFGLNTNLLREYDKTTGEEVGLLLKDGDGTVHRFAKQADGSYKSPAGVFITLSQREDGKYMAHRSDDIDYLFNESMMIEAFSEPNGNKLLFTYDERGRLVKVMHNVYEAETEQQYLAFEYGEQPHNQDRIVKVIAHYSGTGETAVEDVYHYTYGSDENDPATYGMLINVKTAGEQTYTYVETNAEGADTVSSTTSTKTIEESYAYQDGEASIFAINMPANTSETGVRTHRFDLDADDRVVKSTDAIGDYSEVVYSAPAPEQTVAVTTFNNYMNGQSIGTTSFHTDQALYGVVLKTEANGKVSLFRNYDTNTLKPGEYVSYKDAAHTQELVTSFAYNLNGTAKTVTEPDGKRTEYTYISKPDGTTTDWMASKKEYDKNNNLLNRIEYTYDDKGNLLTEKMAIREPDAFNNVRSIQYDYNDRGLRTKKTDWNGKTIVYAYDRYGRLETMTESGSGITMATSYTYDTRNNPATESIARGSKALTTQYVYDGFGRLLSTTKPDGQKEVNNYNKGGRIVSQVNVGAPASDGGTTQAKVQTYTYNNVDDLLTATDALGNTIQTEITVEDDAIKTVTKTSDNCDVVREKVEKKAIDGSYSLELTGTQGQKSYMDYQGNTTKVVQLYKEGETLQETRPMLAEFDDSGNVTRSYDAANTVEVRNDYDASGNAIRVWTYVKTENGTKLYTVKQYRYDSLQRPLSVREKATLMPYNNADVGVADTDLVTTYTYDVSDGSGNTVNTTTAADGSISKTYYNAMEQIVKEEQLGKDTNGKKLIKTYAYDQYGRMTEIKSGAGSLSTRESYSYDALDRIATQSSGQTTTTFTYDYFGRRASMTDVTGNLSILTSWKYDKADNAVQLLQDGKVVNYRYNSLGEMTAMQYGAMGNVRTTGYEYDSTGRVTAVKSSVRPAAEDGAPMDTDELKTVKAYTYAANGDLSSTTEYLEFDHKEDKQGLTVIGTYAYDPIGRPISLTYTQDGVQKEKYTLSYDGQGYILSETYTDSYQDAFASKETTTSQTYTYDAIGRLTQSKTERAGKEKNVSFQYDKAGNRIKEMLEQDLEDGHVSNTCDYSYNNLNQLTEIRQTGTTSIEGQSVTYTNQPLKSYEYDDFGNQTLETTYELDTQTATSSKSKEVRNTYDTANQLIKVEEKTAGNWTTLNTSLYNGEGQRIRRTDASQTDGDYTMYFYMGGALAFSTNSDANFVTDENILDPKGVIVAGKRQDNEYNADKPEGQYWIYHNDVRGSVTNIIGTDASGALYRAESNAYDAFGKDDAENKEAVSSIQNDVKFTGAVQDNTGLYYLSARHYDPNTGRFLQQDTVSGDPYSPWTQNLYTYTSNNPTNYTDPTGHWLFQALAGFVNGIVKGVGKVISNVTTGRPWYEHALGAAAGGFLEGAVYAQTFNPAAASYAGAAMEGVVNEVEDYAFKRKELNWDNVAGSIWNVGKHTAVEGTAGYALGKTNIGGDVYTHLNKGMFKPKSVKAYFFGSFGQKMTVNQIHSSILSTTLDATRNNVMDYAEKLLTAQSTNYSVGKSINKGTVSKGATTSGLLHIHPVIHMGFGTMLEMLANHIKSIVG